MIDSRKQRLIVGLLCVSFALFGVPALAFAEVIARSFDAEVLSAQATDSLVQDELFASQTYASAPSGYANMYRLYNPNGGEHFYTGDWDEVTHVVLAGWRLEGVGWVAPSVGEPVYRLYNPNGGDHHYTISMGERDLLIEAGWRFEGVAWYSDDTAGGVSVYRQYNPNAATGAHNFTMSKGENDLLVERGWVAEGVAWKASRVDAAEADRNRARDDADEEAPSQSFVPDGTNDGTDNERAKSQEPIPEGYEGIFAQVEELGSSTEYAIVVDTSENKVGVFQGSMGSWSLINNFDCSSGASYMPTPEGYFTLTDRGLSFGTDEYTCYYWTRFYGDNTFHSVLYDAGTFNVQDGRIGENLSHGCVRLTIENAKWIYDYMPAGTTVRVF